MLVKNGAVTRDTPSNHLASGLYIVATPIGNLGDMTLRGIDILSRCDLIACEDTRVTGKLLKHLGISKPMRRYDDHSDAGRRDHLVTEAQQNAVVLVSDAGTPLISDPGFQLVRAAKEAGVTVTSLPGPCAVIAALTLSGLPNDRFTFGGFLPGKDKARRDVLSEFAFATGVRGTLIFYETGPRLVKSLEAIAACLPGRQVSVARELTKLYEECRTADVAVLIDHYGEHPPKGEIVLLIGPEAARTVDDAAVARMLDDELKTNKPSQAAAIVARQTGRDRKALYAKAMELRRE